MGKTFALILTIFISLNGNTDAKASSQTSIPNHFAVGSYNLFGLRNESAIRNDLHALPEVQIWAFQEVEDTFSDHIEDRILNLLPSGKWYLFIQKVNPVDDKKGIWEGQIIASRFPFSSTEIIPLHHSNQKVRVALIANFKTENNQTFFFTNTDHEVSFFSDFNDRKKQLLSLVDHFKQTNAIGVITGDFNTTEKQDEINKTEDLLAQANFTRSQPFDNDSYTFKKFLLKEELDHIFTRGLTSSPRYRYTQRKGSDHFPIYIDISL
jgi:endonuclease/exonuclease/phosphatase family metal-dependent hydrolase